MRAVNWDSRRVRRVRVGSAAEGVMTVGGIVGG